MLVDAIRALNNSLSIPANLTEVGVTEDKIDVMADDAMKRKHHGEPTPLYEEGYRSSLQKGYVISNLSTREKVVACRQPFSIEDIICKTTLRDNDLHGKIYYSESYAMYGI